MQEASEMRPPGEFNSSVTRVRPFFRQLIHRPDSVWLSALLRLATRNTDYAAPLAEEPGSLLPALRQRRSHAERVLQKRDLPADIDLERCFEYSLAPPEALLRWLILNPQVACPTNESAERKRLFGAEGPAAQREALALALAELDQLRPEGSKRRWWAFEGFTEVDCCLETERLLLLIEGKRTDDFSPGTTWCPDRHQVARNLEVAREHAGGKEYAVLVIAENAVEVPEAALRKSLPHLTAAEQDELLGHFLGCTTWKAACAATGVRFEDLPETATVAFQREGITAAPEHE